MIDLGLLFVLVIVVTLGATIGSFINQARRGEQADIRRPWRWLLLSCVGGLTMTLAAASNSEWSFRSIGAVVPFALLTPLALAGAMGALHRRRRTDEP